MRITGYRRITTRLEWGRPVGDVNGYISSGVTEVPLVVVETDAGIDGVGFGAHNGIERVFPAIEGRDPRAVTALYDRMLAQVFKTGHSGAVFGAIGALDSALWDIKAKAAGDPLWRLLGAEDHVVPGYASGLDIALTDEQLAAFYREMAELGFASGKIKGGRDADADIRRLGIVAEELSRNAAHPGLMLDANESWNLKQAVRYVARVEEAVDLTWIEEPLRRWDAPGHARLSSAVRTGVASGENLTGLEQFTPLLDAQGVDIVQAGAVWGVTHFLRVAAAAHARDLPVSPVGLTANPAIAHAAAVAPNHLSAEVQHVGAPVGVHLDQHFADGAIVLGDEPGAGIRLDEAGIASAADTEGWRSAAGPHVRSSRAGFRLQGDQGPRAASV